ncbi:ribosomal protein S16 domain-containing protein [Thelephora terrestris]|uniref:Ribosomal protein S16 domain-containing protein n=1 Tax=Thelephora terrestris TaxID=56493 RepID=A0A9P6L8K6_9AGAM|nr:ribosomal protein S16 domain-containing protein [Thelephora terrestris]
MTVRLRLAVHGLRNNRILHLVAVDQRKRRNAKPIELLGIYTPRVEPNSPHKSVEWSVDRIKYWLGVGAQPSDSVVKLLTKGKVIPPGSKWHSKPTLQLQHQPDAPKQPRQPRTQP